MFQTIVSSGTIFFYFKDTVAKTMKQDLKGKKNKKQTSLKPKEYRILYVLRFCFPTTQNIFYSFSFSFLLLFSTDNFLCTKNKNHDPKPKNNT